MALSRPGGAVWEWNSGRTVDLVWMRRPSTVDRRARSIAYYSHGGSQPLSSPPFIIPQPLPR